MTKSELVEKLADLYGVDRKESRMIVDTVLGEIGDALARGDRAEIRGFGSFSLKSRPKRTGRNPKTGESVQVPEKRLPFFKAGRTLRQLVDKGGYA